MLVTISINEKAKLDRCQHVRTPLLPPRLLPQPQPPAQLRLAHLRPRQRRRVQRVAAEVRTIRRLLPRPRLPAHFTMHSFRVGGSLGTPVDKIMQLGGRWKTEAMARHYIGATTSEAFDVKARRLTSYYMTMSANGRRLPIFRNATLRAGVGITRRSLSEAVCTLANLT